MSPCSDLDLENSKSTFLHDTSTNKDASQNQVWKQNVWWSRRYHLDKHQILTLRCDLDPESRNPFFFHSSLANDDISSDQVWLPRNQQLKKYNVKSHSLIIWVLAVILTFKTANQCFCMTPWLIMMHHNTKFGNNVWWFRR